MRRFGGQKTAKAARADGAGPLFLGRVDFFCRRTACVGPEGRDQWAERLPRGAAWGRSLTGAAMGKRRALPFASCGPCRTRGKPPLPELRRAGRPLPSLAVRAASGGIFVFLHSRSGSLSRGAGKRLRIDPVRCVGGLSAGRRKIAPHGRRRCRKSRPLPPSAVAGLRGSRVAGKASCPGPLAGAGVLGTAGKKFSLYRRLERFAFEKGKREVRHRPPGPKSGGKNVFFRDMTGVWFKAPSTSNGKRFRGC